MRHAVESGSRVICSVAQQRLRQWRGRTAAVWNAEGEGESGTSGLRFVWSFLGPMETVGPCTPKVKVQPKVKPKAKAQPNKPRAVGPGG